MTKRILFMLMATACLMLALHAPAFAVPPTELLRVEQNTPFQSMCCISYREKVTLTEPSAIAPVIVTWSTDYQATSLYVASVSVNGGPCLAQGSVLLNPFGAGNGSGPFDSHLFQWVIQPSDGLIAGKNTFLLCGGSFSDPNGVLMLGFNTLSARISK